MSELEFFLLTRVLTQNSKTMELVKKIEKNKNLKFKLEQYIEDDVNRT